MSLDQIVAGHWIVRLRAYASSDVQSSHISRLETKTADASTPFNCHIQHQFDFPELRGYSAKFNDDTKAEIEQMNEVAAVEPVQLYKHCNAVSQKNAPWGLQRISAPGKVGRAPYTYTYDNNAAGRGTVAYIIDTGINSDHIEFEGRASRGPKFVQTWLDQGLTVSDEDTDGHGTHCAGTAVSAAYGVAKKAEVVAIKVFSDGEDSSATNSDIIAAIQYVVSEFKRHGKKSVISMSLGGAPSDALDAAVASAVRSGVVVCVAAGNEEEPGSLGSPSREPLAITVGSIDMHDAVPLWSNFGKIVDVLAPGVDITSCWIGSKTATNTISGTSMATPHVSGVVCCLLSNSALQQVATSEIMSQILIQADKNRIALGKNNERTINAVVQLKDIIENRR